MYINGVSYPTVKKTINGVSFPNNILPILKTGQTTVYQTGDDGTYQSGTTPSFTRYITLGNVFIDTWTNLMYIKDVAKIVPGTSLTILVAAGTWASNHGTYTVGDLVQGDADPDALFYVCVQTHTAAVDKEPPNATYWVNTSWTISAANLTSPYAGTWGDSLTKVEALDYMGFTDWKLPTIRSVMTLVDYSVYGPTTLAPFPSYFTGAYVWTSNTRLASTTWAYSFDTTHGTLGSMAKSTATSKPLIVWRSL